MRQTYAKHGVAQRKAAWLIVVDAGVLPHFRDEPTKGGNKTIGCDGMRVELLLDITHLTRGTIYMKCTRTVRTLQLGTSLECEYGFIGARFR